MALEFETITSPSIEINKQPKLVYDNSVLKPSLRYRIDVDIEKAGDLFRFLGLTEDKIAASTILITNSLSPTKAGVYLHDSKTLKLRASRCLENYTDQTGGKFISWMIGSTRRNRALEKVNIDLNEAFLHEAYHFYDFQSHDIAEQTSKNDFRNSGIGCFVGLGGTIVSLSAVSMLEAIGARTNIACLDAVPIIMAGTLGFVIAANTTYSIQYHLDPIEKAARKFAKEYKTDPEWASIMHFSFK